MMKNKMLVLGSILLLTGLVLAIGGADTFTENSESRWTGASAAAHTETIEGGNITDGDLTGTTLTDKWALYLGEVSGNISLWDGTNRVYDWPLSTMAGEVCASTNSSFGFSSATSGDGADVDTAWSFTAADADSATNTLVGAACSLTFDGLATIAGSDAVDLLDSTFDTCVIDNGATTAETHFAFCTDVQNDAAALGTTADYELMVPTSNGAGDVETYYFYLELN